MQDYIRADQIVPVNDVSDGLGGSKAFPQSLLDLLTIQGDIYSVPSNIHRANVLWSNGRLPGSPPTARRTAPVR